MYWIELLEFRVLGIVITRFREYATFHEKFESSFPKGSFVREKLKRQENMYKFATAVKCLRQIKLPL